MMQGTHVPPVTFQSGLDAHSRGNFISYGALTHGLILQSEGLTSDGLTVFAFANELYNISVTQAPVVWVIGHTTDLAINYTDLSGTPPTPRTPYYKTRYVNDEEMASTYSNSLGENMFIIKTQMADFFNDFSNATSRAQQLEEKIYNDAEPVTQFLSYFTSLALAEVYGSMQLTIWTDGHGSLNKSDVMIFMKNIGGVEKK
jgi:Domain of unknown function (DUF5127)